MEILFKHVKGRKVTRKSPQVQALDLTPVACFPHSGLRCKISCRLAKSVTSDSAEILSLCTNICVAGSNIDSSGWKWKTGSRSEAAASGGQKIEVSYGCIVAECIDILEMGSIQLRTDPVPALLC